MLVMDVLLLSDSACLFEVRIIVRMNCANPEFKALQFRKKDPSEGRELLD